MPQPAPKPMSPEDMVNLTGRTVGRFAIRARLGVGGMGEVYRADDTRLKRPVALKRITPRLQADESYRQRFLREAQYASGLTNQHIAGVYDVLETDGEIFLVMEYVEGVTLRQRLSQPLGIDQFLEMAVQCAEALTAAHERRIVHRDIKPENVMLTPAGHVKILDFGVARRLPHLDDAATTETFATGSSSLSGTPAYMAPEVLLEREPDGRADIFSLGVVFYEALSGRHPFLAGSFLATSDRILHEMPVPLTKLNPKVPAELERIVAKMLVKDPAERYATARDLLVDLRAVQRATLYPGPLVPRVLLAPRRKPWLLAATVGGLLLIGTGFLPQVRQRLHWFSPAKLPSTYNLAVLPFQAIDGAAENQAFAYGMTETLTTDLTKLTATHNLQVSPASEVRTRRITNAEQARKELGATLALTGTLYRAGNTVRVNFAVVDTRTFRQLRADTITTEASDPFAMQDRVAEGVVRTLALELKPQERRVFETHGTQVATAYDLYLQGLGYLQNFDRPESIESAVNLFERALKLDPGYALAYTGLGDAYRQKYQNTKDPRWIDSSRQACERALSLDTKLAKANVCLGILHDETGKYEEAVTRFKYALETEPTSDAAYRGLALAYEHLGKLVEAERTYRQAIALRPEYWAGYSWLGAFFYGQARYPEAAEAFRRVVELTPDNISAYSNLGGTYVLQGHYAEAILIFERSLAIRPSAQAYSNLATARFYQRRFADAARSYEEATKLDERDYVVWGNLGDADYWAPGGRHAQAAAAYQKAISLARTRLQVNPRAAGTLANLASYHAMLGERNPALTYLARALQVAPDDPDVRFKAALVYNQFDMTDRALGWLQKAVAAGYSRTTIRDTPNFDSLRSTPRFQELLQGK